MNDQKTLFVKDSNAKPGTVREHEIITHMDYVTDEITGGQVPRILDSRIYKLSRSEPVEMSESHAMQFLKDDAFIVTDADGKRLKTVSKKDVDVGNIVLEADEVVAKYDELTREALYARCKIIPGAEEIKAGSRKDAMVSFLIETEERRKSTGAGRGSEDVISEMADVGSLIDMGAGASGVDPASIIKQPNPAASAVAKPMANITS